MRKIIEIRDLSYIYNKGLLDEVNALQNINFEVYDREIVAVIGPSGSGKTTLLQHLNGLLMPQSGEVKINGLPILKYRNLREIRKKIGLLFQNPEDQIFERYVGDEIVYALLKFGFSRDYARERLKEVLNMVGYDFNFKNRLTRELSGGEKRLISLLSVISYKPDVLVLDEPTVGLDQFNKRRVIKLIEDWAKSGRSVVMVSHDMNEVMEVSDRLYLLNNGRVEASGETKHILFNSTLLTQNGIVPPDFIALISSLEKRGIKIDGDIREENQLESYLINLILDKKVSM